MLHIKVSKHPLLTGFTYFLVSFCVSICLDLSELVNELCLHNVFTWGFVFTVCSQCLWSLWSVWKFCHLLEYLQHVTANLCCVDCDKMHNKVLCKTYAKTLILGNMALPLQTILVFHVPLWIPLYSYCYTFHKEHISMFQNKGIGFDDGNLNKVVPDGCEAYVRGN